jgi:hypothetical protein
MYPIKDVADSYLGKTGGTASLWLGKRSMPTEGGLYLSLEVISCLFITCIE